MRVLSSTIHSAEPKLWFQRPFLAILTVILAVLSNPQMTLAAKPKSPILLNPLMGVEAEVSWSKSRRVKSIKGNERIDREALANIYSVIEKKCFGDRSVSISRCKALDSSGLPDWFTVWFKDGSWITYDSDWGVVEITTTPRTVDDFEADTQRLDEFIFEAADKAGLDVDLSHESAHLHIGIQSFILPDGRIHWRLLRNFIVDLINHSEVALGALDYDPNNSMPLFNSERARLNEILKKWQQETISNEELNQFITDYKTIFKKSKPKYTAINIIRLALEFMSKGIKGKNETDQRTIEIRSNRMVKTYADLIKLLKLYRARLNYVAKFEGFIPLELVNSSDDPDVIAERFFYFVSETGLNYSDYRNLLLKNYRLAGSTRRQLERKCGGFLKANSTQ